MLKAQGSEQFSLSHRALSVALLSTLVSFSSFAQLVIKGSSPEVPANTSALQIEAYSNGYPNIAEKFLSKNRMIPVETKRLANAKVAWVNLDLLKDMGFQIPVEGITPEFEEVLLDAFAYITPTDKIDADKFLTKKKTFYADRYGGQGVGDAEGSGRAAGAGLFQIKGVGRTPLAEKMPSRFPPLITWNPSSWSPTEIYKKVKSRLSDLHHSHGGATFREAMAEAIWGEVLHRELPYDSNRVAVIIVTDLNIGVLNETRALIVRQNSIRPAHFMKNSHRNAVDPTTERKELKELKPELIKFLAQLQGEKTNISVQDFIAGQKEFVQRVARTFAVEYARGIFHGSLSPSNIELSGRAVDHGPLTYIDGYTKAIFADNFPNGDTRDFLDCILNEFFDDLKLHNTMVFKNAVLKKNDVKQILNQEFDRQVRLEFLWLAGSPENMRENLMRDPKIEEFADLLRTMAEAGNTKIVNVRAKVPQNQGDYDISEILLALADPTTRGAEIEKIVEDKNLRESLLTLHQHFDESLQAQLNTEGYRRTATNQYIKEAVQKRNKKLFGLMRGAFLWAKFYSRIVLYKVTNSVRGISNFIEDAIRTNTRNLPELPANLVMLEEIEDYASGSVIRKVYDGKTAEYQYQGSFLGDSKKINIFGQIIDRADFHSDNVAIRTDDGATFRPTRVVDNFDGVITIQMKTEEVKGRNIRVVSIDKSFQKSIDENSSELTRSNIEGIQTEQNVFGAGILCRSVFDPL